MRFIKVGGTAELESELHDALQSALKNNLKVLWLVPGGSNAAVVVTVMAMMPQRDLHRLTLMLTDERFGAIGHPDSNYHQIMEAGLLEHDATFVQTLSGSTFEETIHYAGTAAQKLLEESGAVIGFFGMGADGHIAGILPHSVAATSDGWVAGYEAEPYRRITLTPFALSHVTTAIVGAFGSGKEPALSRLRNEQLPVEEQPAQILKHIPRVTIYNDQIGDD
jgi:6-phosphogluconolactonase/glucosamine-6-phosphate isomerase/deaminase